MCFFNLSLGPYLRYLSDSGGMVELETRLASLLTSLPLQTTEPPSLPSWHRSLLVIFLTPFISTIVILLSFWWRFLWPRLWCDKIAYPGPCWWKPSVSWPAWTQSWSGTKSNLISGACFSIFDHNPHPDEKIIATQFWCFSHPHCRVKTITQKIYLGGKSNTGNMSWDILEKSDNKNFAGTSNPFLPGTQLVEPLVLMFWTTSGSTRTQTWSTRGETV